MKARLALWIVSVVWCLVPGVSLADEFPPMFPFVISYDGPDNASSVAHLLDAPAGKHGFVRVEGGHFVTDAGPIRFHATNLTGPANFPPHEAADKLASRLARLGINCVRLHFMDTWYVNFMTEPTQAILADDTHTQRNLDPKQLEKLDYMIAAFKKRGIYVNMNLHVGRTLDERDGFVNSKGLPWANKGVGQFVPRMIELQKEYAEKLLTHVNPYTGNAYRNEPCVAMIEISNEDSLMSYYHNGFFDQMQDPYAEELRRQWNAWLHRTYASAEALQAAWKWKTEPLQDEQIPEGSFDAPIALDHKPWSLAKGTAEAAAQCTDGVLTLRVTRNGDEFFPKLFRTLSLKKGQLYTLSFKIRRTEGKGPWQLSMAVATTQGGWRSLGMQETVNVGASWKTVTRVFEAAEDTDHAHLQLTRFKVGRYELDDLSLQCGAVVSYNSVQGFADGSIPSVKRGDNSPPQATRDYLRFLEDTDFRYWTGMYDYLKQDLKVKQPVSGTQLGYSPPHIQGALDYVDIHGYWRHPRGGWISLTATEPWTIENDSMVNSLANIKDRIAVQRVHNKPYTVSEYNHPYPNQFGAEGQPMLCIYGRLQGWDGVFQYSYNHYVNDFEPQANPWCFFDSIARTDVLAHFPACAAIFLRGDVREANQSIVAAVDLATWRDQLARSRSISLSLASLGMDNRLSVVHKTSLDFAGAGMNPTDAPKLPADQKVFVSDTGEITWNTEIPEAAYLAVNTPNSKLFTGFPKGRAVDLGDVQLAVGPTRLDWVTVSLISRHASGFGTKAEPANILLAATGDSGNTGRVVKPMGGKNITLPDRGTAPVLAEGIPATVTLASDPARTACFALDPHGDRKQPIPVSRTADGKSQIVLKPDYQTVWYEIDIR